MWGLLGRGPPKQCVCVRPPQRCVPPVTVCPPLRKICQHCQCPRGEHAAGGVPPELQRSLSRLVAHFPPPPKSSSDDDSGCAPEEYAWTPPGLSPQQVRDAPLGITGPPLGIVGPTPSTTQPLLGTPPSTTGPPRHHGTPPGSWDTPPRDP